MTHVLPDGLPGIESTLARRAHHVLPGGVTRSTVFVPPHPPYAVSGTGAVLTDNLGNELIDCNNNYTSLIHGHSRPEVETAAIDAIRNGSAFGLPTEGEVIFAETLFERTGFEKWRFCNSGTEANLMLARAARAYTGRQKIVRFTGSYHGTGDEFASTTTAGIPQSVSNSVIELPQGDINALRGAFERHGDDIAVVLIDLMPNRAGLTPADPDYVRDLQTAARNAGSLVAVDEVISFRLGYRGLHATYPIEPDLMSLGKLIGGGFPVGAIGGRRGVLECFDPRRTKSVLWGGTFTANPVTVAAGLATLDLYDEAAVSELNARGDKLRTELLEAGVRVRGQGSLIRILHDDTAALWWSLYERGVLAGSNGLLSLSTAITERQLEHVRSAVVQSFSIDQE
ncbi:aspartate aminotransferase family protein [Rhodococcus sp. NPDC057297]|uniref:aspartate aminotransferase family protein n=1 Tax=Rhodococcus sp. NPDC057297 TaxID=3346090 RepID=UPI003639B858